MNDRTKALQEIGLGFFGRESSAEMWALIVVCSVAVFLLYKKLSTGFAGQGEKALLTLLPGILIMALVAAAVRIYTGRDATSSRNCRVGMFSRTRSSLYRTDRKNRLFQCHGSVGGDGSASRCHSLCGTDCDEYVESWGRKGLAA